MKLAEMPKLLIFDLDGTLTESKQPLSTEMATRLGILLAATKIAIVSGGALPQFVKQVVDHLPHGTKLQNLYLLPISGASLYEFDPSARIGAGSSWKRVYEEHLSEKEAEKIDAAFRSAAAETGTIDFKEPSWGKRIEYRGGQVTMSALGQEAPLAEKKAWDPDHAKRRALQADLSTRLPEFSVGMGGSTTIDVTKKGIDKAYGIHQLCKRIGIQEKEALYVGDELVAGGNDEAVYKTEAQTKSVKYPTDTARFIESLLASA